MQNLSFRRSGLVGDVPRMKTSFLEEGSRQRVRWDTCCRRSYPAENFSEAFHQLTDAERVNTGRTSTLRQEHRECAHRRNRRGSVPSPKISQNCADLVADGEAQDHVPGVRLAWQIRR